jgi:hypothetical protein
MHHDALTLTLSMTRSVRSSSLSRPVSLQKRTSATQQLGLFFTQPVMQPKHTYLYLLFGRYSPSICTPTTKVPLDRDASFALGWNSTFQSHTHSPPVLCSASNFLTNFPAPFVCPSLHLDFPSMFLLTLLHFISLSLSLLVSLSFTGRLHSATRPIDLAYLLLLPSSDYIKRLSLSNSLSIRIDYRVFPALFSYRLLPPSSLIVFGGFVGLYPVKAAIRSCLAFCESVSIRQRLLYQTPNIHFCVITASFVADRRQSRGLSLIYQFVRPSQEHFKSLRPPLSCCFC